MTGAGEKGQNGMGCLGLEWNIPRCLDWGRIIKGPEVEDAQAVGTRFISKSMKVCSKHLDHFQTHLKAITRQLGY